MLCRNKLLFLLLLSGLAYAQDPVQNVRWGTPFSGLNLTLDKMSIGDKEFTIFNNGMVNNSGEIYKRGGFSTINTIKIDSNTSTSNGPVNQLYRFYRSNGSKKLLANYLGGSSSSAQFSLWYWLNDYNRFGETYANSPDTMSQVMYNAGTVYCSTATTRIYGGASNFFLKSGNRSILKFRPNGTPINLASVPKQVYIVNDTVLELADGAAPDSNSANRPYELWYRSASSGTTPYYSEATSYLDTALFTRSVFDPMGWDSTNGTTRINVTDFGVADTVRDSTIVDLSKSWSPNQWTGFYVFKRMQINRVVDYGYKNNWIQILSNTATRLTLKDSVMNNGATKEYAIVSMPIDEVISSPKLVKKVWSSGAGFTQFDADTVLPAASFKDVLLSPIFIVVKSGQATGQVRSIQRLGAGGIAGNVYVNREVNVCDILTCLMTSATTSKVVFLRSRFPICKFIVSDFMGRTLWISDTAFQNSFWWSQPSRPGYVKPNDFAVVNPADGEVIQGVIQNGRDLLIGKENKMYAVIAAQVEGSGADPATWQIRLISDHRGISSQKSVVKRGGTAWWYDWPDGFFELGDMIHPISDNIRPLIDSITASARDKVVGSYYPSKKGDFILWGLPINGSTTPNRFVAYSPTTKAWSSWSMVMTDSSATDSIRAASMVLQEGQGDAGELILGLADSGYVMRYNPNGSVDTLNGQDGSGRQGNTSTFSLTLESKRFAAPDGRLRFRSIAPTYTMGGTATLAIDFYVNNSTTSTSQIVISNQSGLINLKKSIADAVVGNQIAWRLTTSSPQTFRLGAVTVGIVPAGRRMPQ